MATMVETALLPSSVDLSAQARLQMIELLNSCLAGILDLHLQAKHAHWNVKGPHFQSMHEMFDSIAGHLHASGDEVAERITALGGVTRGTARQIAALSTLPQYDVEAISGQEHARALVRRLSMLATQVRAGAAAAHQIGDDATADLLIQTVRLMDKDLWFLDAHLFTKGSG